MFSCVNMLMCVYKINNVVLHACSAEANHAIDLCAEWFVDMFDSGIAARAQRQARRRALRCKKRSPSKRVQVVPEMRDEDNVFDVAHDGFGAEYRSVDEKIAPRGGFSDEKIDDAYLVEPSIDVVDDIPSGKQNPLGDAMIDKRRSVANRLAASSAQRPSSRHGPTMMDGNDGGALVSNGAPTAGNKVSSRATTQHRKSISVMAADASMFLSEHDVMGKRQQRIEKNVYATPDDSVEASIATQEANSSSEARPLAD